MVANHRIIRRARCLTARVISPVLICRIPNTVNFFRAVKEKNLCSTVSLAIKTWRLLVDILVRELPLAQAPAAHNDKIKRD